VPAWELKEGDGVCTSKGGHERGLENAYQKGRREEETPTSALIGTLTTRRRNRVQTTKMSWKRGKENKFKGETKALGRAKGGTGIKGNLGKRRKHSIKNAKAWGRKESAQKPGERDP